MASISVLTPATLPEKTEARAERIIGSDTRKVVPFRGKEELMLPCDWEEVGNPSAYELRVTIHTCRHLWKLNKAALEDPLYDHEKCLENIHVLEKLHIHLMAYLVE
ncbi:hypothetical protein [Thiomicrorhabdus xiamenensis]|uniref:Uncharacterized protein n=1 Tax=Thiomicrorhabdus xiamenensis TaxID=2739063 RepID=A0A7D4SI11_9GAMM|nr:hypothetical protein [Thiomicrorhabdus xiamenensis]QKI89040.1 hypothetical protein HQN79_05370 [Thiomicrorhabdus xiamenensis]